MARYTGPVCRLCRRAGEKLFLKGDRCITPKCAVERRKGPPGQKSASRRRRRLSEYGVRLQEKQKARWIYGTMERQFRRYFEEALRKPGATGQYLLQLLERRLDNTVYRLGFADSRAQARQLVTHGHITVNSKVSGSPSSVVEISDVISWKPASAKKTHFQERAKELGKHPVPNWLSLDPQTMSGTVLNLPQPEDIETKLDPRLIVELYSR